MRGLNFVTSALVVFFLSCIQNGEKVKHDYQVLAAVYNSIPKEIPKIHENENSTAKTAVNKRSVINHNYAVNTDFMHVSKIKHYIPKSHKIVNDFSLDRNVLDTILNNRLQYLKGGNITKEEGKKLNIVGVISFTPIFFNDGLDEAYVGVLIYRGKLDSSFARYKLSKEKGVWKVMDISDISFS